MSTIGQNVLDYVPSAVARTFGAFLHPIRTVFETLRSSFLLTVAAVGIACLGIAVVLSIVDNGVFAGMFGVWGISTLLATGAAYAALSYLQ